MAPGQQASAEGNAVEGVEDKGEADLAATTSMKAAGVADTAATIRATEAVAADLTASATIVTRADICGAIATSFLMDGLLLKAKRVEEQEEGEEEAVEAVAVAEMVLQVTLHSLDYWVIDSGATYSMTPRADLLTELEPSPVKHVTSALGQRAEMKGMGKAMFKGADGKMVGLKNVLWVPSLAANLISVRRLQKAGMDTSSKGAKTYAVRLDERILWDLHEDRDVYNEMWQIPVVPMHKERQVAASISTKGEAVGSGDGANGRAKEIKSKKCNLGGTSKLGEHEESGAVAQSSRRLVKNEIVAGIRVKGEPDEVLGCPTCMQAKFTCFLGGGSSTGGRSCSSGGFRCSSCNNLQSGALTDPASTHTAFFAGSGATSPTARLSFTLDSGASSCFFRDCTNLTPLRTPVTVALADPSVCSVVADSTTTLPCLVAPSGFLIGYYTPSLSRNLVGVSHLHDLVVVTTFPLDEPVAFCTFGATGAPLATLHREPGFGLYSLHTGSHHTVSGLPESLSPLPRSPAPPCTPCVDCRQRTAPHSSPPPTTAPLHTLHLDVWGPSSVRGPLQERHFLIVVDDYSRYTTVFPLRRKADVPTVLEQWLLARGGTEGVFGLRLHSDCGGEFSSTCLQTFYQGRGIIQSYTLLDSPQQIGVAKRRIGLVIEVARNSMCHAGAPKFLWPQAVHYAAHQLNLWPSDARPRVMPIFLWTGFPGIAADYRVWGCLAHVRAPCANKVYARTCACVFLGFPLDASGWVFYDPVTQQFFASQDVTFDESVSYHRSHPHRGSEAFSPPLFLTLEPPPVIPVAPPPLRPAPSGVSHVTPQSSPPQRPLSVVSGSAGGVRVENTPEEDMGVSTQRPRPASPSGFPSVPQFPPRSPPQPVAAEPGGVPAGGTRVRGGVVGGGSCFGGAGAGDTSTVTPTQRTGRFLTRLQHLDRFEREERERFEREQQQQQSQLERQERVEESRPQEQQQQQQSYCAVSPEPRWSCYRADGPFHLVLPSRVPPPIVLPQPPESSLGVFHDPLSEYLCASHPVVSRVLFALVTHPTAPLSPVLALVTTVAGFASSHRLDYAAHLVSGPAQSPFSGGAPIFPQEVLKDGQFELGFLATAVPHLYAMLLAPKGDPDALDIPILRNHTEAVSGPWALYWIAAEEAEMASYRSTGTYVDTVPPPGANIVSGMWLYKVKQPHGAPPVFKARFVARGFSQ
ncbi:unnamed protein product [Closterium sp. NIES-53]